MLNVTFVVLSVASAFRVVSEAMFGITFAFTLGTMFGVAFTVDVTFTLASEAVLGIASALDVMFRVAVRAAVMKGTPAR